MLMQLKGIVLQVLYSPRQPHWVTNKQVQVTWFHGKWVLNTGAPQLPGKRSIAPHTVIKTRIRRHTSIFKLVGIEVILLPFEMNEMFGFFHFF